MIVVLLNSISDPDPGQSVEEKSNTEHMTKRY